VGGGKIYFDFIFSFTIQKTKMKSYKRLDSERPLTFSELSQRIPFFKKAEWIKLLQKVLEKEPELTEKALYMNRELDFYSPDVIEKMKELSLSFKEASLVYEEEREQNSPRAKLARLLNL
jgi:hypothetical protein